MGTVYILGGTFFKRTVAQSSILPPEDKVYMAQGETLQYVDGSLRNSGEHYQVETLDQIAPWGCTGFFYSAHIKLEVDEFASKLVRYCRSGDNYYSILQEARRIRGALDNTCVAFQSEALRRLGISVPIKDSSNGENISLVTKPYSKWLIDNLNPTLISSYEHLRPGDLCFSADEPGWPGYPAHTFIFESYYDSSNACVIDNYPTQYIRNLDDNGYKTPFAYALRIGDEYMPRLLRLAANDLPSLEYFEASAALRAIPKYVQEDLNP